MNYEDYKLNGEWVSTEVLEKEGLVDRVFSDVTGLKNALINTSLLNESLIKKFVVSDLDIITGIIKFDFHSELFSVYLVRDGKILAYDCPDCKKIIIGHPSKSQTMLLGKKGEERITLKCRVCNYSLIGLTFLKD